MWGSIWEKLAFGYLVLIGARAGFHVIMKSQRNRLSFYPPWLLHPEHLDVFTSIFSSQTPSNGIHVTLYPTPSSKLPTSEL
jgi:hypothetical protein